MTPGASWWAPLICVNIAMEPVDVSFRLIQGMDTLIMEHNVQLWKLADGLKDMLNIIAVTGMDMLLYVEAGGVPSQCVLGPRTPSYAKTTS